MDRFLQILKTKRLYLPKIRYWEDPWELGLFKTKVPINEDSQSGGYFSLEEYLDCYYGLCFSIEQMESDLTWKIFSANNGICVRFSINAKYLWTSMKNELEYSCYAGMVSYEENQNIQRLFSRPLSALTVENFFEFHQSLFIKRKSFKHESEFRLVYFNAGKKEDVYSFPIEISQISNVLIGSTKGVSKDIFDVYADVIKRMGYKKSVEKSCYYDFPQLKGLL